MEKLSLYVSENLKRRRDWFQTIFTQISI